MSYEILYGKQFIKVDDKRVIPMIYTGSNNCYEWGSGNKMRRERNWHMDKFFSGGILFPTGEQILAGIDKYRNELVERYKDREEGDKYKDESFGYFTSIKLYNSKRTTFGLFKSFYKTGVKQAMTVEQLKEFGIELKLRVYFYKEEELTSKGLEARSPLTIESTEEIEQKFNEWKEYYGEESGRLSFYLDASDYELKKLSKSRSNRVKKEKKPVEVNEYWVLAMVGGTGYFVKSTKRSIRHTSYSHWAKTFLSEKEVNAYHKRMRNKGYVTPEKITEKITLWA